MASRRWSELHACRICRDTFAILSGEGAARYPGPWNSLGRPVIYAAAALAGAMLEILAHANIGRPTQNLHLAAIRIPARVAIEEVPAAKVDDWLDGERSRRFGDLWHDERRTAVLLVPSAVTRVEYNVPLDPSRLPSHHCEQARARELGSAALRR